jgi:hypothetical protein
MVDRTAIDTIKGYFYQFDYSIIKLLELPNDTDTIIVEGIEDVDINTATEETAIQCKYYAQTKYNHSVIAKPIRLMLDHYKKVKDGTQQRINYKLYGHFKSDQHKLSHPIDLIFLKEHFLTHTENKVKNYHYTKLSLNDTDLDDFLSLLTIDILASDYQSQLSNIFKLLKQQFGCTEFEAQCFYYNNALKVIKDIAVEGDMNKRKIIKSEFLKKINFKRVLFNEWYIQIKGEKSYYRNLRNEYFTHLNISPFERFFIIEVPSVNYSRPELKDLLFTISKKWSQFSKRTPEPFCPYIYLHTISQQELIELKSELDSEGYRVIDGFNFKDASFCQKTISKPVNKTEPIKFKILNELNHVKLTLNEITKTKEVYQFYITNEFFHIDSKNIKQVKIQVSKLINIKEII